MHDEIIDRMDALSHVWFFQGYEGYRAEAFEIIQKTKSTLMRQNKLGPWEDEELKEAARAADANFLNLALCHVDKALTVSQLSVADYHWGFKGWRQ